MNKKYNKTILLYLLILFCAANCSLVPQKVSAAPGNLLGNQYVPLAPLPPTFFPNQNYDLSTYLQGMFKFLIALSGLLAVIMIVLGGVQYMSTDAIGGKSDGKEKIENALLGLFLALISWLILYTINPKLLEFKFNAGAPSSATGNTSQSTGSSATITGTDPKAPGSAVYVPDPYAKGMPIDPYAKGGSKDPTIYGPFDATGKPVYPPGYVPARAIDSPAQPINNNAGEIGNGESLPA